MNRGEFLTLKSAPIRAAVKGDEKLGSHPPFPHQAHFGTAAKEMRCPNTEARSNRATMRK